MKLSAVCFALNAIQSAESECAAIACAGCGKVERVGRNRIHDRKIWKPDVPTLIVLRSPSQPIQRCDASVESADSVTRIVNGAGMPPPESWIE